MTTCRSCFYCIPNYKGAKRYFHWGTCFHAQRKVNANMTACSLHEERSNTVALKSTPEKRNVYKDKDGVLMKGYTLPEVLDVELELLAKREYRWGKYEGLAVKACSKKGVLFVIEITAETPIRALNSRNMPKLPCETKFIQKTSATGNKYYTVEAVNGGNHDETEGTEANPLSF